MACGRLELRIHKAFRLSDDAEYLVKEAGSASVYISNDNPTQVDVCFDEVSITHTPTNIIQYNEYYPFGLQAGTSWTRENNKNDYLYNGGSKLNTASGWYETMFRGYDPILGRFMQVDPLASVTHSLSPYQYADCNPVLFNDPSGLLAAPADLHSADWSSWTSYLYNGGGGSAGNWSAQYGGGARFVWNPIGGEEISREEWLNRGGNPNLHADKYYPGAWEIQMGGDSEEGTCSPGMICYEYTDDSGNVVRRTTTGNSASITALKGAVRMSAEAGKGAAYAAVGEVVGYFFGKLIVYGVSRYLASRAVTAIVDSKAAALVSSYNKIADPLLDCSDIAAMMNRNISGGTILELAPKTGKFLNGLEYGQQVEFTFHQVFEKAGYIYDPMFSSIPVKTAEFMKAYLKMNPGGFNIIK